MTFEDSQSSRSAAVPFFRQRIARRWALAAILAAFALVALGGGFLYRWWTSWSPRLILNGSGPMIPLAFSPDDRTLVTGDDDGLALWDVQTGTLKTRWYVESGRHVFEGLYTTDGQTFAAITYNLIDRTKPLGVSLIDVATGRERGVVRLDQSGWLGHALSTDGRTIRIVTTESYSPWHVADVDLEPASVIEIRTLTPPEAAVSRPISSDGKRMALGVASTCLPPTWDKSIWDLDEDREIQRPDVWPGSDPLAFSPDGSTLALGSGLGEIGMWNVASQTMGQVYTPHHSEYELEGLTFSPDGSRFVSFGQWRHRGWSLNTAKFYVAAHLRDRSWQPPIELVAVDRKTGRILGSIPSEGRPVFSPDGRMLATTHTDGTVRLREVPVR